MKAPSFEFIRARSLEDVFDAFERYGDDARIIAGGQSLALAMNMRLASPAALVDINHIHELAQIDERDGVLRIGALVRHAQICVSPHVARAAPLLSKAAPNVAHAGIRNRGTFGGSLANADPASEFPACVIALGARINVSSREGPRSLAADDFFRGLYETALEPDEIIVSVDVPLHGAENVCAFNELMRRSGDYATAGIAAHGRLRDNTFSNMRLVFFGVSDRPVLAATASARLEQARACDESIRAAQAALADDLTPMADLHTSAETKAHLARVLCGRALREMAGQT